MTFGLQLGPMSYLLVAAPFDSYIMRVLDFLFQDSPSWSGDFQQNANNVDFLFKSAYIETFDQNLISNRFVYLFYAEWKRG